MMQDYVYAKMNLYKRLVEAKLFIDDYYYEDINTENIANEACFSKFHFIRIFKKTYCYTPNEYLQIVRIFNAKRLLRADYSIEEVCYRVGYGSPTSFAGLFKKFTQVSPSAYQQNQKKLIKEVMQTPVKYIPGCYLCEK